MSFHTQQGALLDWSESATVVAPSLPPGAKDSMVSINMQHYFIEREREREREQRYE